MIRRYPESMPHGDTLQQKIGLEFYLTHCQLEIHIQGDATLYDLELKGNKQSPLNIFDISDGPQLDERSRHRDRRGSTTGGVRRMLL